MLSTMVRAVAATLAIMALCAEGLWLVQLGMTYPYFALFVGLGAAAILFTCERF